MPLALCHFFMKNLIFLKFSFSTSDNLKAEEDFKEEQASANSDLEKDLQTATKRNTIKIMQKSLPNKYKETFQKNVSTRDETTPHNVEETLQNDELSTSEENAPNYISEIPKETNETTSTKEKKLNTSQKKAISRFTSSLFKR